MYIFIHTKSVRVAFVMPFKYSVAHVYFKRWQGAHVKLSKRRVCHRIIEFHNFVFGVQDVWNERIKKLPA